MFVEVYRSGRMGYAFTDVRALAGACAVSGERAVGDSDDWLVHGLPLRGDACGCMATDARRMLVNCQQ